MPPTFSSLRVSLSGRIGRWCFKPGRCAGMVGDRFHRVSPGVMNRIALRASQHAVFDPNPVYRLFCLSLYSSPSVPCSLPFFSAQAQILTLQRGSTPACRREGVLSLQIRRVPVVA